MSVCLRLLWGSCDSTSYLCQAGMAAARLAIQAWLPWDGVPVSRSCLLGWWIGSLGLLAQARVAVRSWCSPPHGAALRFTNKQEASPLPACWGRSPVLIAQLAQRRRGSPGFTRQLPGRGAGGILGPTTTTGSPALHLFAQLGQPSQESKLGSDLSVWGSLF